MTDAEITQQAAFHFYFSSKEDRDPEMERVFKELDSVSNLNSNPMAIRRAALEGIRRAYVLGARWAMERKESK